MTEFEERIFREALDKYGRVSQITMVMEEMSELQKELCKNLRGRNNTSEIAEEIADVSIMLDQMKMLFGCEDEVSRDRAAKVVRLQLRLRNEEVIA